MSYTDEEYKQLGGNIDPDIWKNLGKHKARIPLVGTLARLIYAEMNSDPVGQACVAQELHNRMRNWVFGNKAGISYLEEEYQNWYGILFEPDQYSPMYAPHPDETGPLFPAKNWDTKTPSQKAGWINAVDLATVLVNNETLFIGEPFDDVTAAVNMHDQMRHRYFGSEITEIEASIRELGQVLGPDNRLHSCFEYYNSQGVLKRRWDPIIIGNDVFYNDEDTVGNK